MSTITKSNYTFKFKASVIASLDAKFPPTVRVRDLRCSTPETEDVITSFFGKHPKFVTNLGGRFTWRRVGRHRANTYIRIFILSRWLKQRRMITLNVLTNPCGMHATSGRPWLIRDSELLTIKENLKEAFAQVGYLSSLHAVKIVHEILTGAGMYLIEWEKKFPSNRLRPPPAPTAADPIKIKLGYQLARRLAHKFGLVFRRNVMNSTFVPLQTLLAKLKIPLAKAWACIRVTGAQLITNEDQKSIVTWLTKGYVTTLLHSCK